MRAQILIATIAWCLGVPGIYVHQINPEFGKDKTMQHASGPFDVKLLPQKDEPADPSLGRMILDKQYHGDLEASAAGQMLYGNAAVEGSGAYVAIEKVTGTLQGRKGSFILCHRGVMQGGKAELSVTVVPDSGTGDLAGLDGKMNIIIAAGGKHSYEFDYFLPSAN
jgi:Protein of unknown function (DUF3224)